MNEFNGPKAVDASGNSNDGEYEPGVAFYLEGSGLAGFPQPGTGQSSGALCRWADESQPAKFGQTIQHGNVVLERAAVRRQGSHRIHVFPGN